MAVITEDWRIADIRNELLAAKKENRVPVFKWYNVKTNPTLIEIEKFISMVGKDGYNVKLKDTNIIINKRIINNKNIPKTTTAVIIPTIGYITDDNRLSLSVDLNTLKGYENLKNSIKNNNDIALVQQALDKVRDLANTIEGALAGEEPYPDTYYRMCQEVIELLTKIKGVV